jgi:hypothetical protein
MPPRRMVIRCAAALLVACTAVLWQRKQQVASGALR